MHPLRLVRIALEAELLRLQQQLKRTAIRVVLGCIAVALLLGALGFGHVAAWFWLRDRMAGQEAALIFTGVDLLFAMVLGVLALRSSPGRAEREALMVRRRALDSAAGSLTLSALAVQVLTRLFRSQPRA